jgi:hypothetical protein
MGIYWQMAKNGQQLMLEDADRKERLGMVRETPRGFDALAVTFGYEPERARRDIASMEEAKTFVEAFKPWVLYIADQDIEVEPEVRARA